MFVLPVPGKSVAQKWSENSTLPADLIAAGQFDQAMHTLNRQIGVVNFAPLKPVFMSLYNASYCLLPQLAGGPPLTTTIQSMNGSKSFPVLFIQHSSCVDALRTGYKAVTDGPGKFKFALETFLKILRKLPFVIVDDEKQAEDINEMKLICAQYVTALRIALERRNTDDKVRQAKLLSYFTKCDLQQKHVILGLKEAIKACYSVECFKTTAGFCRKLIDLVVSSQHAEKLGQMVNMKQIKGILRLCEKTNKDKHDLDFSETESFEVCCETFTAIKKGADSVQCPYCATYYHDRFDGQVCKTCDLSKLGAQVTGLKSCRR